MLRYATVMAAGASALSLEANFVQVTAPVSSFANQTHYGNPADGCEADETAVQVTGLPGDFCAPDCAKAPCPTDVPPGVTATPQCALTVNANENVSVLQPLVNLS